jgi:hypothetical protein
VLQGNGLDAVQDAPRADPDAQRHDVRPARAKMKCENRQLNLVLRSQGSPLQRGLKRPQENATDDAVLWGVSDHIVPIYPPSGSCPESLPVGFCGVNFGRLGFYRKVGALLFDLARRNKAAGSETAAACNRCDAVLWSRAWRSEPCVDRLCLPCRG